LAAPKRPKSKGLRGCVGMENPEGGGKIFWCTSKITRLAVIYQRVNGKMVCITGNRAIKEIKGASLFLTASQNTLPCADFTCLGLRIKGA